MHFNANRVLSTSVNIYVCVCVEELVDDLICFTAAALFPQSLLKALSLQFGINLLFFLVAN